MANEKFSASGTITARLVKLETKKSAKGNTYATAEFKMGEATLRMSAFKAEVVTQLSGFVVGEEVPMWIMLSASESPNGKVYTNANIGKVYTDGRETQGKVFVNGEVLALGDIFATKDPSKKVGRYVDIDVTQNEQYPTKVRVQLAFGTDTELLSTGDEVSLEVYPNKFGAWVFDGEVETAKGGGFGGKRFPKKGGAAPAPAGKTQEAAPAAPVDTPW